MAHHDFPTPSREIPAAYLLSTIDQTMARQHRLPGAARRRGRNPTCVRSSVFSPRHGGREGNGVGEPSKPAAALYVIATPLGNLGDVSARARHVLAAADIAAVLLRLEPVN